jgi:hypothetical protein
LVVSGGPSAIVHVFAAFVLLQLLTTGFWAADRPISGLHAVAMLCWVDVP